MKRFTYTAEHLAFLRREFPNRSVTSLTEAFNTTFGTGKTESQIRSALKNHKIRCGRAPGEVNKGKLKAWTPEQFQWLKLEYRSKSLTELTTSFNDTFGTQKTEQQMRSCLRNHKVRSGRTGHFPLGQAPWNTGTKGIMQPNSGNFAPGHIPANRKPLYSERICAQDGYILIKVPEPDPHTGAPTRYRHKHVWLWEKAHGPVPEDRVVSFIDGDKLNCDLANLELLHRRDVARFNQLGGNAIPPELRPAARLVVKVSAKSRLRSEDSTHG
ncbi:HNH endonuclease [Spongiibacter sp. KMU-166]|uniref:HNH endonuclease n=1 Tax=Spongiibacter thalassae TaxID=2721624 RepID=A0ABX1GEQ8_9GAMM|nr:HNH endonuclease signature motif containing protein [Spongiibacter thalassae]NKI17401.1 HNH endonuclease [Spongiibacter thalassae]